MKKILQRFLNRETITYLMPNPMVPDQPIVAAVHKGYTDLIGILIDRRGRHPLIQLQKGRE